VKAFSDFPKKASSRHLLTGSVVPRHIELLGARNLVISNAYAGTLTPPPQYSFRLRGQLLPESDGGGAR